MFSEVTNVSTSEYESTKLGGRISQRKNQGEESYRHLHGRGKNGFLLDIGAESVQLEKPGKVSKLVSLSSKRPRVDRLEDPTSVAAEVDGIKDMPFKLGSLLTKCGSSGNICLFWNLELVLNANACLLSSGFQIQQIDPGKSFKDGRCHPWSLHM